MCRIDRPVQFRLSMGLESRPRMTPPSAHPPPAPSRGAVRLAPLLLALLLALAADGVHAGGFLGLPATIDGQPANVGVLILGHSTSASGQYPEKLLTALNHAGNTLDGRHYVLFRAVTGGDGGLLWSRLQTPPGDLQYDRVTASSGVGESSQPQWCQDAAGVRWSCRRAKLEHVLTGSFPIPSSGGCADATVGNGCRAVAAMPCTWHDRTLPPEQNPVTQSLSPSACWAKMDFRIALVQDTTNRSWPLDDFDADGAVTDADRWPAARIRARALPCGGGSGVVGGVVDWSCDGVLDGADAAHSAYADWLQALAGDLVDDARYGAAALDFVFVGQKPVEMGQCSLWPADEQAACNGNRHTVRTAEQVAATPDRPFDHHYLPTVYWEHAALADLFARADLDPRLRRATPDDVLAMWRRSAACYDVGVAGDSWTIPLAVGRPASIAADDAESDTTAGSADATGCMVADHVHHNDPGGWLMADVWYAGLRGDLATGVFADGFAGGDAAAWSAAEPPPAP